MQTLRYTSYQHLAHVQKRTQKCRAPCTAKLYTPCHQPPDGSMEVSTSPQEAPSCPPLPPPAPTFSSPGAPIEWLQPFTDGIIQNGAGVWLLSALGLGNSSCCCGWFMFSEFHSACAQQSLYPFRGKLGPTGSELERARVWAHLPPAPSEAPPPREPGLSPDSTTSTRSPSWMSPAERTSCRRLADVGSCLKSRILS